MQTAGTTLNCVTSDAQFGDVCKFIERCELRRSKRGWGRVQTSETTPTVCYTKRALGPCANVSGNVPCFEWLPLRKQQRVLNIFP